MILPAVSGTSGIRPDRRARRSVGDAPPGSVLPEAAAATAGLSPVSPIAGFSTVQITELQPDPAPCQPVRKDRFAPFFDALVWNRSAGVRMRCSSQTAAAASGRTRAPNQPGPCTDGVSSLPVCRGEVDLQPGLQRECVWFIFNSDREGGAGSGSTFCCKSVLSIESTAKLETCGHDSPEAISCKTKTEIE
ncbi:hypothetical protein Q8A73_009519 [Channa argus]|nr:hypothetical protein Q8A73_009519 [Channa argus]